MTENEKRALGSGAFNPFDKIIEKENTELLAKIRARRDKINGLCDYRETFYRLFDDGAEFGPPKPEPGPKFTFYQDRVEIQLPMGLRFIERDVFEAIKKLGREEARDE